MPLRTRLPVPPCLYNFCATRIIFVEVHGKRSTSERSLIEMSPVGPNEVTERFVDKVAEAIHGCGLSAEGILQWLGAVMGSILELTYGEKAELLIGDGKTVIL